MHPTRFLLLASMLLGMMLTGCPLEHDEDVGDMPDATPNGGCQTDDDCSDGESCMDGECVGGCVCPAIDEPVCGADGVTYSNPCSARCAGVEVESEGRCDDLPMACAPADCGPRPDVARCPGGDGPSLECVLTDAGECRWDVGECPDVCACPDVYDPVCGADGMTYGNACEARCAQVEVVAEGECRDEPVECRPVDCGPGPRVEPCPDGNAPPQECRPDDAGICTWFVGECPGDCACGEIWAPVCGADGMTYSNPCEARCAGVEVAYEGECRDEPGECREDECGPPPFFVAACPDGSPPPQSCERGRDGMCGWVIGECPDEPAECREDACGPPPFLIAPCPDGNPPPQSCERGEDGVCGWVIGECADEPGECTPEECGPGPRAPNIECPDGSIGGPVCGRDDAGMCGWTIRECPDDCLCGEIWAPVCGADGNTYENPCRARCAGVAVVHEGECGEPGECAEDACGPAPFLVPVCPDGSPPPQECVPDADGVCRWRVGGCEPVEECARDACGPPPPVAPCPDGNGPSMECLPRDDGQCGWVIGQCEEDCACFAVWDPVCGADGNTYGNACEARCAGVPVVHAGECGGGEVCADDACGPAPRPAACPDGSVPPMACVPAADGACGWEIAPCPGICDCPEIFAPVCGADGNTYDNECHARCAGVEVVHDGACEPRECREDACGPAPFLVALCPDGQIPEQVCAAGPDGVCRWQVGECPEPACAPDACGPPPPVAPCPDGNGPTVECVPRDDGVCGWEIGQCEELCACPDVWEPVCGADGNTYGNACEARCAGVPVVADGECGGANACGLRPDPGPCEAAMRRYYYDAASGTCEVFIYGGCMGNANNFETEDECLRACGGGGEAECAADECGPAPGAPNFMCDDGSVGGPVCERSADGVCGWMMRECPADPAECAADQCGPAPRPLPCEDGSAPAQACVADDAGRCGWITECGR